MHKSPLKFQPFTWDGTPATGVVEEYAAILSTRQLRGGIEIILKISKVIDTGATSKKQSLLVSHSNSIIDPLYSQVDTLRTCEKFILTSRLSSLKTHAIWSFGCRDSDIGRIIDRNLNRYPINQSASVKHTG